MKIGERISEVRKSLGMTHYQLAKYVGTSERMVYYWESDRKDLRVSSLIKVANAFNMTLSELTNGVDGRYDESAYL